MAYLDSDGNFRIVGRRSDMYIRGGYNVYPLQVKNVIAEHPAVAVMGIPDEVLGEIGVAFVVLTFHGRDCKDEPVAGPDQVFAISDGKDVEAGLSQHRRDLGREVLVE